MASYFLKYRKRWLVFFVLLAMANLTVVVYGGSIKNLQKKQNNISKMIDANIKALGAKKDEISLKQKEILVMEKKANELEQELALLEEKLNIKKDEIIVKKQAIKEAEENERYYYDKTMERIKVMYEYGNTEYLAVLLESKNTSDFYNRLEYMNKLVEYDRQMLSRLEETRYLVAIKKEELLVQEAELEHAKAETSIKKNQINALTKRKTEEVKTAMHDTEMLARQLSEYKKEKQKVDRDIASAIRRAEQSKLKFSGGDLAWPLPNNYRRITSKFGPRFHPVYKRPSVHTGVDVAAPKGTPIRAAASGKVIFAGWGNAYGNYVLVNHGKNKQGQFVITQYAHCSALKVKEGDVVVKGKEIIGLVGSTGWSTGNHLHFGLKIGGNWVDPMNKKNKVSF